MCTALLYLGADKAPGFILTQNGPRRLVCLSRMRQRVFSLLSLFTLMGQTCLKSLKILKRRKICEKYTKYKTKNKENAYIENLKTVENAENLRNTENKLTGMQI